MRKLEKSSNFGKFSQALEGLQRPAALGEKYITRFISQMGAKEVRETTGAASKKRALGINPIDHSTLERRFRRADTFIRLRKHTHSRNCHIQENHQGKGQL